MNDRNQQTATANSAFYDERWKEQQHRVEQVERLRAELIVAAIRDCIAVPECTILDLGCGRGWMAKYLSVFGKVTGTDFSPLGIEFANQHYSAYGQFRIAKAGEPNWGLPEGERFHVVVNTEVIEHVEDHRAFLGDIKKLMRPNGWLVLTTPNGNVWREFSTNRYLVHSLQPIENWLAPSRLSQLLRSQQFRIVRHEGFANYRFRFGKHRWLQRRLFEQLLTRCGLGRQYRRFILTDTLYQLVVAQMLS